jgi:competence protein ComGC
MLKKTALITLGLTVLVLVAAQVLLPSYVTSPRRERELIIRQDFLIMRSLIGQYTLDKQKRPHSLDDLVVAGYLKDVPIDPTTKRKDTWILECSKDPRTPGIIAIGAILLRVVSARESGSPAADTRSPEKTLPDEAEAD